MTDLILLSVFTETQLEIWRPIPIDGLSCYEVSNLGRVRTFRAVAQYGRPRNRVTDPRIMRPIPSKYGYMHFVFYAGKRRIQQFGHRLVAKAFVPNPMGLRDVNHKNMITSDNRADNLEWMTSADNLRHAWKNKARMIARGSKSGRNKIDDATVYEIRRLAELGISHTAIAKYFKLDNSGVSRMVKGTTWGHLL